MTKYKFSRNNWFEYNLLQLDGEQLRDMHEWCCIQFGDHPKNPDAWSRWHVDKWGKIKFLNQDDFVLFTLRWG